MLVSKNDIVVEVKPGAVLTMSNHGYVHTITVLCVVKKSGKMLVIARDWQTNQLNALALWQVLPARADQTRQGKIVRRCTQGTMKLDSGTASRVQQILDRHS